MATSCSRISTRSHSISRTSTADHQRRVEYRTRQLPRSRLQRRLLPAIGAERLRAIGQRERLRDRADPETRVVPLTATIRFLPLGHASVEPYVGAGIGAFNWRYSETGEFVDFDDVIFRANYVADGTAWGPVVVGGVRFPFGDMWDIGGELRYQWAEGDTKPQESQLLGDKIDLGGLNAAVTFHVRF